jgi:uncharacterized phage protein (TIGR02218 family)
MTKKNSEQNNSITEYVLCWHIKFKDGRELGFTNHNVDINIDNCVYLAKSILSSNVMRKNSAITNAEDKISGIIDHQSIKEFDILSGKFDDAIISIYLVDYKKLSTSKNLIKQGYINKIEYANNMFCAHITTSANRFNSIITQSFSPHCRARFCDKKCKLAKANHTKVGKIVMIKSKNSFFDDARKEEDLYYNHGVIRFLSGEKKGIVLDVKSFKDQVVELVLRPIIKLNVGDEYEITAGCDKQLSTCIKKFNNAINFRGEPYISDVIQNL